MISYSFDDAIKEGIIKKKITSIIGMIDLLLRVARLKFWWIGGLDGRRELLEVIDNGHHGKLPTNCELISE